MSTKKIVAELAIVIMFFTGQARAELVWGKPTHISVSENAPEQERFAAREFQRLYRLRTGTELKIYPHAGGQGVLIGRITLREYPPVPPASKNPPGLRRGRGEDREHYIQKVLQFNFDELESGGFAYMTTGWVMDYKLLIAGKTPADTIEAVYGFCEQYLGVKRLESGEFVAADGPVKDWGPVKRVSGLPPEEKSEISATLEGQSQPEVDLPGSTKPRIQTSPSEP